MIDARTPPPPPADVDPYDDPDGTRAAYERQAPHDQAAEQAVLGGMLLSPRAVQDVVEILEGPEFYRPAHETIYQRIVTMTVGGALADPITVAAELRKSGDLDRVGGPGYLHELVHLTPTAANAEYYAELVRDLAIRRRLVEAGTQVREMGYATDGDLADVLTAARDRITDATKPAGRTTAGENGWGFADLTAVLDGSYKPATPTVGARADGIGMFYPGRVNGINGEAEAGKSWVALMASLAEIQRGNHVVYLDFEDSEEGIVSRLLLIGARPDAILSHFHYVRPQLTPTALDIQEFVHRVATLNPTLVVLDGVTEAMSMLGLELKDNTEIARFGRMLLRPLAGTGAAVVPLDHVVKDSTSRGRYALGGVHKLNAVDGVQYTLEAVRPFGINAEGRSRLRIAKDRPAQVRKHALPGGRASSMHWFADLVIKSTGDQFAEARLYPPVEHLENPEEQAKAEQDAQEREEADIKDREEKVLEALRGSAEPMTKKAIEELIPGRASVTRRALTRLVHAGKVEARQGTRGAVLHALPGTLGGRS